jgi:2',5'-phosphodiesterase
MVILEPVANDKRPPLCVVNTHLFFHPGAPHIRLMQAATLLEKASTFIATYGARAATQSVGLG